MKERGRITRKREENELENHPKGMKIKLILKIHFISFLCSLAGGNHRSYFRNN